MSACGAGPRCACIRGTDARHTHAHGAPQGWALARAVPWHKQRGPEGCLLVHLTPGLRPHCCWLPELPALCSCVIIPFQSKAVGVAPLLPLRRGHGAAIPKLAGQTDTSKAVSFTAGCQAAGRQRGWRQGGADLEHVLAVGRGLSPPLGPRLFPFPFFS